MEPHTHQHIPHTRASAFELAPEKCTYLLTYLLTYLPTYLLRHTHIYRYTHIHTPWQTDHSIGSAVLRSRRR